MGDIFAGIGEIWSAAVQVDSWMMSQALRGEAAWVVGLVLMLLGGFAVMMLYRLVPFLERHLESYVMVISYLAIGAIIFFGVIQRFVPGMLGMDFSTTPEWLKPWPWTTTLPPFLFLVMTWVGCSYNVKLRTHLSFSEFRINMARVPQITLLTLDAILWIGFSWIVVVTGSRVVANSAANFQIMMGTNDIMTWWFLLSVPIAFVFLVARVLENLAQDWRKFRSGETIIEQAMIGGDT